MAAEPAGSMTRIVRLALVGERNEAIVAHRAIEAALPLAASNLGITLDGRWLATDTIGDASALQGVHGVWCVPGSPYASMEGALLAIRVARTRGLPLLGTCGGFQHAVLEYARHVLGWSDAGHAETMPDAARPVITPLACALVEASQSVRLVSGTRLAQAYCGTQATERYHCRYGLNPAFCAALLNGPLIASAFDATGEVRAIEHTDHPFLVATLFQPERAALRGEAPPLVIAFARAALGAAS
jgi:CTP synthase (UTP-ammonia lyase)